MRNFSIYTFFIFLCTGCTLPSDTVPHAPMEGSQAVVFDIDGTLTPSPYAIFSVRPDAANAVRLFADRDYEIIYLSARLRPFQSSIIQWLTVNKFPAGRIHVPQTREDTSDHVAFKQKVLEHYQANGWVFAAAYGDSSSDFEAYANVGINKERVFALKRKGEVACEPGIWIQCLQTWGDNRNDILRIVNPYY